MAGNLSEEMENFRKEVENSFEESSVGNAIQKGSMDFEAPQNPIELLQQIMNPSEYNLENFPEISRDFGTSNIPKQNYVWLIYNKLETAKYKKNLGLKADDEYRSALAILMLLKSYQGWQVRELRTSSVRVDRPVAENRSRWFRR